MRPKAAQEQEHPAQIEIGDAVVFLVGVIEESFSDMHRRGGDRDIEAGAEFRRHGGERGNILCLAGIDRHAPRFYLCAEFGRGSLDAVAILVGADDVGAERGEHFRRRLADAGGRAQHHGGLAGEI